MNPDDFKPELDLYRKFRPKHSENEVNKKRTGLTRIENCKKIANNPENKTPRITKTMKDTIQEVWNRMQVGTNVSGMETNLYFIASEDPKWFYEWCKPMLPKSLFVEGEVNNNIFAGLTVEQLIDIAKASCGGSGEDGSEE